MTALDDARAQLRARPVKAEPEPWRFPAWRDFRPVRKVLAFDATLSHCGWALMLAMPEGFGIMGRGCISPQTELTGYLETWEKMSQLGRALELLGSYALGADAVVVEAPSVGGGHRTESSLIAGGMISAQWPDRPLRPFRPVSATHVSSVLLGNSRMPSDQRKKAIREAVIRLCPEAAGRGYNEHVRDAIATGAVYLFDEKQKEKAEREMKA